jgi:pyridoxine/pyridoxamine 5'-phosphate oxidase
MSELAALKEIVDSNLYMTLATADADGRPWAAPVWFAHADYTRFVWVSKPEARHSQNLAVRPEAGIVIFDSTVSEGAAQAVYLEAQAEQLGEDEAAREIQVFSRRSQAAGWPEWSAEQVLPPAPLRLYRANATAHFLLGDNDERVAVSLG